MRVFPKLQFLLATKNRGKVREVRAVLEALGVESESLLEREDLPEVEETGTTFSENARLKAIYYNRLTGIPSLADDSGLVVDALDGAPGVFSARFASTDQDRIEKLLELMHTVKESSKRTAHFVCVICFVVGKHIIEVTGQVDGEISLEPRGQSGFGYDPVFYYPPLHKTLAEMSLEEKSTISHRGIALEKLYQVLKKEFEV